MRDMLIRAGFTDIRIEVKENAADIISGWMPGSGAEKDITSAYVTAKKPLNSWGLRDHLGVKTLRSEAPAACCPSPAVEAPAACCPSPAAAAPAACCPSPPAEGSRSKAQQKPEAAA